MKKRETIDAVSLMRSARARLARKCRSMTFAEQRRYLDGQLSRETVSAPQVVARKHTSRYPAGACAR